MKEAGTATVQATSAEQARLDALQEVVLGARVPETALAHAAAIRMVAAATLSPVPRDLVAHVDAAHAAARPHLARLTEYDPAREVRAAMNEQVFAWLTEDPRRRRPIDVTQAVQYTYTPRKVLRRVLDHALDHLSQIDQWLAWQRHGVVPVPTDGWVPSTVTLPDDRLPLTAVDLGAWLWRIDQAIRLLSQRAAGLTGTELDWPPPDGGWPLRRVIHHVARSESLYVGSFIHPLPEDPILRYTEASRRLAQALAATARNNDPTTFCVNAYGIARTPGEAIGDVLTLEGELVAAA